MSKQANVKILAAVESRFVNTKNGQRQVFFNRATLETEKMRVQIEVEVDGPDKGYAVGGVYEWDLAEDLIPGRYGPELARRMTLVPKSGQQPASKAA